jgi:hypothetical protein
MIVREWIAPAVAAGLAVVVLPLCAWFISRVNHGGLMPRRRTGEDRTRALDGSAGHAGDSLGAMSRHTLGADEFSASRFQRAAHRLVDRAGRHRHVSSASRGHAQTATASPTTDD